MVHERNFEIDSVAQIVRALDSREAHRNKGDDIGGRRRGSHWHDHELIGVPVGHFDRRGRLAGRIGEFEKPRETERFVHRTMTLGVALREDATVERN